MYDPDMSLLRLDRLSRWMSHAIKNRGKTFLLNRRAYIGFKYGKEHTVILYWLNGKNQVYNHIILSDDFDPPSPELEIP